MAYAVQQGQNHTLLAHCRGKGAYRTAEIVCLAAQQNDIIGPLQLALLNGLCRGSNFAVLTFYDQTIPLQLGRARGPYEKSDVRTALEKLSAEISPERARAQHQVSHLPLICPLIQMSSSFTADT
jgi:hypothetical protein